MKLINLVVSAGAVFLVQCSDSKSSSGTVFGNMTFSNTSSNDATLTTLTKLVSCTRNADYGTFDFEAMSEDGNSSIKLRVKGFKSTMETYTCTQTADNRTGTSLGSKFDNCFVFARVASPTGVNAYSMYREEAEKNQSFTYGGTCQIQFSEATPRAKGKVVCSKMIQTVLNGTTRNPISDTVTGDVSAEFDCQI
ncbi:MAG: hypothetical protein ACO3A4_05545 [Silvanigrellaceae bacterium]